MCFVGDFSLYTMVNQRQDTIWENNFGTSFIRIMAFRKSKKEGPPKKDTGEQFLQMSLISDDKFVFLLGCQKLAGGADISCVFC